MHFMAFEIVSGRLGAPGAPNAAGSPTAVAADTPRVFYRTDAGTIVEIFEDGGGVKWREVCTNAAADPSTATTIAIVSKPGIAPDRSPNNQNVNDLIRVASIIVVIKTIADERKVVTMTPARINLSGEAPARPRAS